MKALKIFNYWNAPSQKIRKLPWAPFSLGPAQVFRAWRTQVVSLQKTHLIYWWIQVFFQNNIYVPRLNWAHLMHNGFRVHIVCGLNFHINSNMLLEYKIYGVKYFVSLFVFDQTKTLNVDLNATMNDTKVNNCVTLTMTWFCEDFCINLVAIGHWCFTNIFSHWARYIYNTIRDAWPELKKKTILWGSGSAPGMHFMYWQLGKNAGKLWRQRVCLAKLWSSLNWFSVWLVINGGEVCSLYHVYSKVRVQVSPLSHVLCQHCWRVGFVIGKVQCSNLTIVHQYIVMGNDGCSL